jgi:hypothetical protein
MEANEVTLSLPWAFIMLIAAHFVNPTRQNVPCSPLLDPVATAH